MLDALPEPDRTLLSAAPLNLVVASLSYASESPWPPQLGLRFREDLAKRGFETKLVNVNQPQVTVSLQGAPPESRMRRGFQLTCVDGPTLTVHEDALVIESRKYDGWAQFRTLAEGLIAQLSSQREIAVVNGLALRYVNALSREDAISADFWAGKVRSEFLGAATGKDLLPNLRRSVYLLSLTDGTVNGEVRIGVQPDAVFEGRVAFVFDMEFADTEPREFDASLIMERYDTLNTAALKMFQQIVTKEYLEELAHA